MQNESATSRTERLVGLEGVQRLAHVRVMVLGLGGVGSNCVEALARGGIGHFILVDRDVVDETNINRQAIAFHSTVGKRKIDVMQEMIADINPEAHVETLHEFVHEDTLPLLVKNYCMRVDYVIDAIDTISSKLALAQLAQEYNLAASGIKLIAAMGSGMKQHPEYLRFADIYETQHCRMCRIMRKECRKRGIRQLQVLYSCEHAPAATAAPDTERSERSGLGTMSYFPPIMGQMLASWVIRDALEIGVPHADAIDMPPSDMPESK